MSRMQTIRGRGIDAECSLRRVSPAAQTAAAKMRQPRNSRSASDDIQDKRREIAENARAVHHCERSAACMYSSICRAKTLSSGMVLEEA